MRAKSKKSAAPGHPVYQQLENTSSVAEFKKKAESQTQRPPRLSWFAHLHPTSLSLSDVSLGTDVGQWLPHTAV